MQLAGSVCRGFRRRWYEKSVIVFGFGDRGLHALVFEKPTNCLGRRWKKLLFPWGDDALPVFLLYGGVA